MEDTVFLIIGLFFGVLIPLFFIIFYFKETKFDVPKYMKRQLETKEDNMRLLHFIQQIMKERYNNFLYVAAHHISTERRPGKTTYHYHPYIIAFNSCELIIISYLVKDGNILCRYIFPVDFSQMKITYKLTRQGVSLTILSGHEMLPMDVDRIVKSSGYEQSCTPLGIYQEAEVEQLICFLPGYSSQTNT